MPLSSKDVMQMSPLQHAKLMKLKVQSLIQAGEKVSQAAFSVGYNSAVQPGVQAAVRGCTVRDSSFYLTNFLFNHGCMCNAHLLASPLAYALSET